MGRMRAPLVTGLSTRQAPSSGPHGRPFCQSAVLCPSAGDAVGATSNPARRGRRAPATSGVTATSGVARSWVQRVPVPPDSVRVHPAQVLPGAAGEGARVCQLPVGGGDDEVEVAGLAGGLAVPGGEQHRAAQHQVVGPRRGGDSGEHGVQRLAACAVPAGADGRVVECGAAGAHRFHVAAQRRVEYCTLHGPFVGHRVERAGEVEVRALLVGRSAGRHAQGGDPRPVRSPGCSSCWSSVRPFVEPAGVELLGGVDHREPVRRTVCGGRTGRAAGGRGGGRRWPIRPGGSAG